MAALLRAHGRSRPAGRAGEAPPGAAAAARGDGRSRRAGPAVVGARLRRRERARPRRRLGNGIAARRTGTAGSPAARRRPRRISAPRCVVGSRPADEALEIVDRLLAEAPSPWLAAQPRLAARDARSRRRGPADRPGGVREGSRAECHPLGRVDARRDLRPRAATTRRRARRLRVSASGSRRWGSSHSSGYYLARLGRSLCMLGRFDEAEAARGTRASPRRGARPRNRVRRALAPGAWHAFTRTAATWPRPSGWRARRWPRASKTQWLNEQCVALCDLAEVLAVAGRTDEAAAVFEQALERCAGRRTSRWPPRFAAGGTAS